MMKEAHSPQPRLAYRVPAPAAPWLRSETLLLICVCLAVIAVNWPWLTRLGLEYDEAHSLPAAVKMAAGSPERLVWPAGVYLFHRPIPFMTAPYIGALDAYIYAVSFAVFGSSTSTLRVTNLAFTLLILVAAYVLGRSHWSRTAGALTLVFLASDTEFLIHSVMNYGPFVVQLAAAAFAIVSVRRWVNGDGARWLALSAMLLGLGLAEKLTFILFLGGLLPALFVLHGSLLLRRLDWRSGAIAVGSFAVGALPLLLYAAGNAGELNGFAAASASAPPHWGVVMQTRVQQFHSLLSGVKSVELSGVPAPQSLQRFSILWPVFCGGVGAMVVFGVWAGMRRVSVDWRPPRAACAMVVVVAAVLSISALFPDSGRAHHLILAYPFVHCAAAISVLWFWEKLGPPAGFARRASAAVFGIVLALQIASSKNVIGWFSAEIARSGGRGVHSAQIETLTKWIESQPNKHFVFGSWGLYRPVFALSGGAASCTEFTFVLLAPLSETNLNEARRLLRRRNSVFVFLHDGSEEARERLFAAGRSIGLRPRLVAQFHERDGSTLLYEGYVVEPISGLAPGNPAWRSLSLEGVGALNPVLQGSSLRQVDGSRAVELRASPDEADIGRPLGVEVPLPGPSRSFRFTLSSRNWDRFTGVHIELVGRDGVRMTTWVRPFRYAAFLRDEETVEVGPDLYPDGYFYSEERGGGEPGVLRIYATANRKGASVDLTIRDLAVEATSPAVAQ